MSFLKSLFGGKGGLLDSATHEAVVSIDNGKIMFLKVMDALRNEVDMEVLTDVKQMDCEMNRHQMDVRRMVFEHLSVSKGQDLLASLVLLSIVIDTERIGDYTKNIAELVENFPARLHFDEFEELFIDLKNQTTELFDLTKQAFVESDEAKARKVMENYGQLSPRCDSTIKEILTQKTSGGVVKTNYLVLVLMLRHVKRVMAHLKNIASTVVNPFDRIGYQAKSQSWRANRAGRE